MVEIITKDWNEKERRPIPGSVFTVELDGERLHFTKTTPEGITEEKTIPVVRDLEYTCKAQKTQFRAIGGAAALYKFIGDNAKIGDLFNCYVEQWCNHVFDVMKGVRNV